MLQIYEKSERMKNIFYIILCTVVFCNVSNASTMFDASGRYNSTVEYERNRYMRDSAASAAARYYNLRRTDMSVTPYRYDSLNYTRIRKVKGGYGDYSARCSDIGDVSFCH